MSSSALVPLFFSMIAAFVTTVGLIAVAARSDWSMRYAGLMSLVAGGMLVTLVILHLAPEAMEASPRAPAFLLAGFFGGLVLTTILRGVFGEHEIVSKLSGSLPVIAIALHSFIDGIVYSVTFSFNIETGIFATAALILHEFPEGVIAFALLRGAGISNRQAFIFAFLAAALTTPLGVAVSAPFTYALGAGEIGELFAISAGLLLFVATGPLLSNIDKERPARGLIALAAGAAIAIFIASNHVHDHSLDSHNHEHDHDHSFHEPVRF